MENGQDGTKTCEDVLRTGLCKEIGMTIQCFFPFLFLNKKKLIGQYVVSKGRLCTWYLSLLIIP